MTIEPLAPIVPDAGILAHVRQMNRDALGVLVAHPDGVRRVLQENPKSYSKATRGFEVLRKFPGNGARPSRRARAARHLETARRNAHDDPR